MKLITVLLLALTIVVSYPSSVRCLDINGFPFAETTNLILKHVIKSVFKVKDTTFTPQEYHDEYVKSLKGEGPIKDKHGRLIPQNMYKIHRLPRNSKHVILTMAEAAGIAYCELYGLKQASQANLRLGRFRTVYTSVHDGAGYHFLLLENLQRDMLIVSIRGSKTYEDWKYNVDSYGIPPHNGSFTHFPPESLVHPGFQKRFLHTKMHIITALRNYYAQPGKKSYNLYITGHSLGGGVASLTALFLAQNPLVLKFGNHVPKIQGLYNYNMPMIGNKVFVEWAVDQIGHDKFIRVVNGNDFAPHFGLSLYGSHPHNVPEYFWDKKQKKLIKCKYGLNMCSDKFSYSAITTGKHSYVGYLQTSQKLCKLPYPIDQKYYVNND
ncbi:hypothetical protein MP638_003524 [Amoeboaphelidium occidentale]|nr:hypothetical protein MP638_003524 [Amoeboaphelidium occidentale]